MTVDEAFEVLRLSLKTAVGVLQGLDRSVAHLHNEVVQLGLRLAELERKNN